MRPFKIQKSLRWLVKNFFPVRLVLWVVKITLLGLGLLGFTTVLYVGGLVAFILSPLLTASYLVGLSQVTDPFYLLLVRNLSIVARIIFRIEIIGKENIPEQGRAFIAARHRNAWDIPFV